jgi:hypothetical protein
VEFNDGSMYRTVLDPSQQIYQRAMYCHRAASARNGAMYVDPTFAEHREALAPMRALLFYQYVWEYVGTPEAQAEFLLEALGGPLRVNEMVMLDIEAGGVIVDPVDFTQRWLAVIESELHCRAWIYVPSTLAGQLTREVTGDRVVMAPRYSGLVQRGAAPWWSHDVHQYTDSGTFPGCRQTGDVSYTALTPEQLLARCNPDGITCECAEGATGDV